MEYYYQLIPRDSRHLSSMLSFLLLGRETELTIRNNGYISIVLRQSNEEIVRYLKNEMNTEIRRVNYFPELRENVFFSNYPKYFFNSFFPFILETALMSQLGDVCYIKTEKFRTFRPYRKMLYGRKIILSPYRMRIYLPFLAREYISKDGRQALTMHKGYKIVVTQQEMMTYIATRDEDGLLAI
ncbi:MAG: hypothetical protein ACP5MU_00945 [Thermoplasmata archaeon]